MNKHKFLPEIDRRLWQDKHLFLGRGSPPIEIVVATSNQKPSGTSLKSLWKSRRKGRSTPVLLVVLYENKAYMCGPTGEDPPVMKALDRALVEKICRETLKQSDRHAALRFLNHAFSSLETTLPGINNEGLLALHELREGVPVRSDWNEANTKAAAIIDKRNKELLSGLGFCIEPIKSKQSDIYLLLNGRTRTALAVLLEERDTPELGNERFNNISPVSYAIKKADDENLKWAILVQGSLLRLYCTSTELGVGQRGRTDTFVECKSTLLPNDQLGYLWLLFSADALAIGGSLSQIIGSSQRFSGDLADRLRERIYGNVVPTLATGLSVERNVIDPTPNDLSLTYEMALIILFRLLFIAYAEDQDLLPYRSNENYRRRSLKNKAMELAKAKIESTPISSGSSHWQETSLLFQAISDGNQEWGIPAYGGDLFTDNPEISKASAHLKTISLSNKVFESVLRDLLVINTPDGIPGPVDFRSLGVMEFGTVYEGLLESELAVAKTDLSLRKNGVYEPVKSGQRIDVQEGSVYLHNKSGERKSSGSYYTKPFAVRHLLERTVSPALNEHFKRLTSMNATDAAKEFFDFRVADLAMGSGHFLIGAIDHIESRMTSFLTDHPLTDVRKKLTELRTASRLGLNGCKIEETSYIEDSQLIRRLIARRCIYGVDINPLSVQLARLAVWIHTFVPGLPLSYLDHNLGLANK